MIRVGFVLNFADDEWLGGVSYFRNLLGALHELLGPRIEPVVITRRDTDPHRVSQLTRSRVLHTVLVEQERLIWRVRRAAQLYLGRDPMFEALARRHRIAVLSHSGYLGHRSPVPALCWIPDFQELYLPELFSHEQLAARRRNVEQCCRHASVVLLSSEAARRDLQRLRPDCVARARVLRFVAAVPDPSTLPAASELEARYGFTGKFIHLPNQFWVHKNHRAVVEALGLLAQQGRQILVLATGHTADPRRREYFSELMQSVNGAGLANSFRVLGVVPYRDLMGLMAASVAVVNPSLFEGWSTSVEEAKSMGKRIVLSNIPVHREQSPARAEYFEPRSASELAACLWRVWSEADPTHEAAMLAQGAAALPGRREAYARAFEDIVLAALGSSLHHSSANGAAKP